MKSRRLPRADRSTYQRPPLPVWVRVLVLTTGWILVVLGVVGIFLPILQGGLCLALGFALLSVGSQTVHLWLRKLLRRWPGLWKRLERLRRRILRWIRRRTGGRENDLDASTDERDVHAPARDSDEPEPDISAGPGARRKLSASRPESRATGWGRRRSGAGG